MFQSNDNKNYFLKLPKEIIILIILDTMTTVVNMVQTCKHLYSFVDATSAHYTDRIWPILAGYMFNCELTRNEYVVKQIFSYKSLPPMVLIKYAVALIEPIIILFDKNNMAISDLLIYLSHSGRVTLRLVHKNQIKYEWKTINEHIEIMMRCQFHWDNLVIDHKILRFCGLSNEPVYHFRDVPTNLAKTELYLFSPHNPADANFHIKF